MYAVVSPDKIHLPPGTVMRLPGTWQNYQTLAQQRGDSSTPRIKYRHGEILLTAPLPIHGRDAHLLSQIATEFLNHADRDYEAFTPITLDLPEEGGIEPDYCFYIDNFSAVVGKARIDWKVDPPPDLAIEVDVTSFTDINDYQPYRIPEVWLLRDQSLKIYLLTETGYHLSEQSQVFSTIKVVNLVAECLELAYREGSSRALRKLRQRLSGAV